MKTDSCPKCGSPERVRGKIFQQGTIADVRFKADDAPALSLKKQMEALACQKCGFIEFFLADHDA
jgi:predicted nucleic-acid-binding Zn-ribbon protein